MSKRTATATTASISRRQALRWLGVSTAALGSSLVAGCGGGSASSSSSASSSDSSSTSTSTSTTTPTTSSGTSIWPWAGKGVSTTATVPAIGDFVRVIASGSVTYAFHVATTSSTTDPVTGAVSDTSSAATLQPYYLSKFLVTNANWKAFCNSQGSSYYPSTAQTAGQYWSGGAYPAGKENHPVFFVSLVQAQAYCAWLETQIGGYEFYVPTEGEWEYAALGGNTSYSYPWGANAGISYSASARTLSTAFNSNAVCTAFVLGSGLTTLTYYNDTVVTTLSDGSTALNNDTAALSAVLSLSSSGGVSGWQYDSDSNKSYADFANSDQFREVVNIYGGYSSAVDAYPDGRSWCGCYDMAGNAYEWTSTLNVASNGAEAGASVYVVKGGSWYATSNSGKSTGRGEGRGGSGAYHSVGFRVAARAKQGA